MTYLMNILSNLLLSELIVEIEEKKEKWSEEEKMKERYGSETITVRMRDGEGGSGVPSSLHFSPHLA